MQSLIILGRQPKLGLAELESLYGADKVHPIADTAAAIDVDPCLLAFDRLGGAVKFAKVLDTLNTTSWDEIGRYLSQNGPKQSEKLPQGKLHLGISAYGFNQSPKNVQRMGLQLKQAIRRTGRSVRVMPNNESDLSSAQVIHGQLTRPNGWEILIIKNNQQTVIAQTVKVQDIKAYARRDQSRPARDAKVGMLPPKLAQIIINLASGLLPEEARQSVCDIPSYQQIPKPHFEDILLLDPFCGSGVILQEAAMMGYDCIGSDLSERMTEYSQTNLDWIRSWQNTPINSEVKIDILSADATTYRWPKQPTVIASETHLGRPFSSIPKEAALKEVQADCERIIRNFLSNIGPQIKVGTRICLAIPAWRLANGEFAHLPLLDSIEVIGYNRVSFRHVLDEQLIYCRPEQIVARELLVISKQ